MTFIRFGNLPKTAQPKSVKTPNSFKNNYLITSISTPNVAKCYGRISVLFTSKRGEWGNGEWVIGNGEMGNGEWQNGVNLAERDSGLGLLGTRILFGKHIALLSL